MLDSQDPEKLFRIEVRAITKEAEGVFLVSFDKKFDFKAGQVVALTTDLSIPPRLYSIASGEDEIYIRILFNIVPEGVLTTQLSKFKSGNHIYIGKPFGGFIGTNEPAYWIAAGTGIAPFASMFYSDESQDKILIHGGRTLDSFYFENDFRKCFGDNYIRCCSREKGNGVYEGRLTKYLNSKENFPKNYKYYLCGSSEMVVETRDILLSKEIPFENIIAEIYF
jgi:ferredoxin--NADP+ reductase